MNKIIGILTKTVSVIWLVYINSTTNKFFKQPVINIGKPKYISIGPKDDHQKQKALLIQYEWAQWREGLLKFELFYLEFFSFSFY